MVLQLNKSQDYNRVYLYPSKSKKDDQYVYSFLDKIGRKKTELIIHLVKGFLDFSGVTDVESLTNDQIKLLLQASKTAFNIRLNASCMTPIGQEVSSTSMVSTETQANAMSDTITTVDDDEDALDGDFYNTDTTSSHYDIMEDADSILSAFDM